MHNSASADRHAQHLQRSARTQVYVCLYLELQPTSMLSSVLFLDSTGNSCCTSDAQAGPAGAGAAGAGSAEATAGLMGAEPAIACSAAGAGTAEECFSGGTRAAV